MKFGNILKILGILLMVYSITLLPPILVDFIYHDDEYRAFIYTFFLLNIIGFTIWLPNRSGTKELRKRDGFLIVFLCWTILSVLSSLPFILATNPGMSVVNALFESVSGLTTTGATVISNLDELPYSILYYRNQLQFLGGMGIIILAVAILPMLGIGGMQLYKAEMTGIAKDSKLAPRITHTAKMLWGIYVTLLLLCIASYMLAGMDLFNAVCVAFGTVSTGGYVPHDASIGFYNNRFIELVSIVFMTMGGINFSLHFIALRDKSIKCYFQDQESMAFLKIILIFAALITVGLLYYEMSSFTLEELRVNFQSIAMDSLFHVVSLSTTTGFVTSDGFGYWPGVFPFIVFYIGIIGACAGSTSGGLKIIRMLLMHKQGLHEIKQLIHPQGRFFMKYGEQILDSKVANGVWGFMAAYLAIFIFLTLLLVADGNDFVSAFSGVATAMSNVGPGLADFTANFTSADTFTKLILSFAMIMGRLEIFTVLVLFSPYFWYDT